jgi:branched-chain amino acid transport system permease protein
LDWIPTILNGLLLGGLYGLLGLGLALVFGIMRIANIAHGEIIVMAAFFCMMLQQLTGLNPILLLPVVALVFFGLGYGLQIGLLNRLLGEDPLVPLLATFGLSTMLRNLMGQGFGADIHRLNSGRLPFISLHLGFANIGMLPLIILAISTASFIVLALVIGRTGFGRMVRATADNFHVVQMQGVNYSRIYALVMGIAFALTAIAGVLLGMRTTFTPYSGVEHMLLAFEVVVIGGLGSLWGPLLAGFALGVVHLVGLRFDPDSGLLYPDLLFFLVLLVRPQGFAGLRQT